jgi:hypothetical protein
MSRRDLERLTEILNLKGVVQTFVVRHSPIESAQTMLTESS